MWKSDEVDSIRLTTLLMLISAASCLDFRCHCNSPTCISTDYLCNSHFGCYVERQLNGVQADGWPSESDAQFPVVQSGCVEDLPADKSFKCWADDVWDVLKDPSKIRVRYSDSQYNSDHYLDPFPAVRYPDSRTKLISIKRKSSHERQSMHGGRWRRNGQAGLKERGQPSPNFECCFKDLCNIRLVFELYQRAAEHLRQQQQLRGSNPSVYSFYLLVTSVIIFAFFSIVLLNLFIRGKRQCTVPGGCSSLVAEDQMKVTTDEGRLTSTPWHIFTSRTDHSTIPSSHRLIKPSKKQFIFATLANCCKERMSQQFCSNVRRV